MRRAGEWNELGGIVGRVIDSLGLRRQYEEHRALGYWAEAAGERLAGRARPVRVQDGVLWLKADSVHWATEISLRRQQILEKINEMCGLEAIREIRFVGAWNRDRR